MDIIPFEPPFYARSPHFQTIATHLMQKIPGYVPRVVGIIHETAVVPTIDGTGDRLVLHVHRFHDHSQPAVLLVHGLEGSADSLYMIKMAEKLLNSGFHVIRMNLRSCGAGRTLARRTYHCGLTIDIEAALEFVKQHVSSVVALVGFSLGSNLTIKYLGEDASERNRQILNNGGTFKRRKIKDRIAEVFCAISIPLDVYASCEVLDSDDCKVYREAFMKDFRKKILDGKFGSVPGTPADLPHIKSWFEVDHLFTGPAAGFRGAIEYHTACSSKNFVSHVDIPGLLLHARDDPMIHANTWEEIEWKNYPNLTAELTDHGGHLGWFANKHPYFPDRRWMDYRVLKYLEDWRESRISA